MKTDLRFILAENLNPARYSKQEALWRLKDIDSVEHFIRVAVAYNSQPPVYISTKIGFRKYIPFIDCDSGVDGARVLHQLQERNLRYLEVLSSNDKSWFFVDRIGSFHSSIDFMAEFRGIDTRFLEHQLDHKDILVRSCPKRGKMPQWKGIFPVNSVGDPRFDEWVSKFSTWWSSDIVKYAQAAQAENELMNQMHMAEAPSMPSVLPKMVWTATAAMADDPFDAKPKPKRLKLRGCWLRRIRI